MRLPLLTLLLFTLLSTGTSTTLSTSQSGGLRAQRVLLFEKLTASKSERMYEAERLKFKMKGDKFWQEGPIREMRPDIQALVINDRFIMLDEIAVVDQGNNFLAPAGYGLVSFGLGWSFWSVAGNYTDGDPATNYSAGDFMVTATTVGTGYLLAKVFGRRRFKTGKYKRLRVVDTSF